MIVLDENFPESQRATLTSWRANVRQIGVELGRGGMKDEEIIPLLHKLTRPTFFTLDADFFRSSLCHPRYCLMFLDVEQYEAAVFIRRILKHAAFDSAAKRMGCVLKVSQPGIVAWRLHQNDRILPDWV